MCSYLVYLALACLFDLALACLYLACLALASIFNINNDRVLNDDDDMISEMR